MYHCGYALKYFYFKLSDNNQSVSQGLPITRKATPRVHGYAPGSYWLSWLSTPPDHDNTDTVG